MRRGSNSISTSACATERGTALVGTLVVFTGVLGLVYATTVISTVDMHGSRDALDVLRADQLAESGHESAIHFLSRAVQNTAYLDPIEGLEELFGGATSIQPFVAEPLLDGVRVAGAYSTRIELDEVTDTAVTLTILSTGYVPDAPQNLPAGEPVDAWSSSATTVRYSLEPSAVFDNAYFINNWGWFYGNTILCKGNARSNGQFDAANYRPLVTGQATYDSVSWDGSTATLSGYRDDNGDGLEDGEDGGIFAGWDIVGADRVRGRGGQERNQHDFQEQVDMPNLSDLTQYEEQAVKSGASLSVGGIRIDGVYGDDAGESGNLYLHGTAADPVQIDGAVVVQGDVIISGYVTGQGAIYSGGNVYCPDSVQYVNPPPDARPDGDTQEATEDWLSDNWDKDFLGLFARENVVLGDHTHPWWQYYVKRWMSSSMNKSYEDAGEDGIPNTRAGRDGILGTADDDVLEDDGVFTVETYTEEHADLGLIPPGKNVGDVIPGTGEDIDGDGVYDDTTTYEDDMAFDVPLDTAHWGGNMPPGGIANYSDVATLYANRFDAAFYTNHAFAWLVLGNLPAKVNGSIISRNESIIYGTPNIHINYDCRLLGGNTGMAGNLLPRVMQPVEVLRWRPLDEDPNRYVVLP